jgi:hypothetical protein
MYCIYTTMIYGGFCRNEKALSLARQEDACAQSTTISSIRWHEYELMFVFFHAWIMYRYQQISRAGMTEGDKRVLDEAVARADMLQRNAEALHQEKMQLEDALRRFENVNAQIEALHSENRKLDEAFARYRADAEAWRAAAGGGMGMDGHSDIHHDIENLKEDTQRWREHAQKQEDEIARLQRLLADQSKALLSGVLSPQKNRERDIELYKLRDQVLALDRNVSPAIRELQKQVIQQKIYEESGSDNGTYRSGGGGSAPPLHDPSLRSTLPDALPSYRDTGSYTPDLFSSLSSQTPLHSSLPGRHMGFNGGLRVDRVDSSLMDAYRLAHGSPPSSSSSPPMLSGSETLHRALSGSAPLYADGHTPQQMQGGFSERSKSPEVDPFSGVRLGIPEDILNYQPPSVTRKPQSESSLISPSGRAEPSIRGANFTTTSHTSSTGGYTPSSSSRVLTNASFSGELRRTGTIETVRSATQGPVARNVTSAPANPSPSMASNQMSQDRKVTSINTGLSPSEYVSMRFKGASPATSAVASPSRSPPGSASKQLHYGDASMVSYYTIALS